VSVLKTSVLFAILILVAHSASGQSGNSPHNSRTVVRTNSNLVIVPTVVRSDSGELIENLDADDFRLTDQQTEQQVHVEEVRNQSAAVVLLLQTGGAASRQFRNYDKLDRILESILDNSTCKLALVTFDSRVRQIWAFPPRVDGLDYGLTHQEGGDHGAAIRDAVLYATSLLQAQSSSFRRIILLFSQREDAGSRATVAEVMRDVARSGATVYSLTFHAEKREVKNDEGKFGTLGPKEAAMNNATAAEVAAQSGGEIIPFENEDQLAEALSIVGKDLHAAYLLSFRPSTPTLGLHAIKVEVIGQRGGVEVLARRMYWIDNNAPDN